MIFIKRVNGFIDINKLLNEIGILDTDSESLLSDERVNYEELNFKDTKRLKFKYNNDSYLFKYNRNINIFNELIAQELTKDFGLECVNYDIATLNGYQGVVSNNFKKDDEKFVSGTDVLSEICYYEEELDSYNNLYDIWNALDKRYNADIVAKLMGELVNLFIFDIITCQVDRHCENWGIFESKDEIKIKVFDNERMLIGTNRMLSLLVGGDEESNIYKNLKNFESISDEKFKNIIYDKLWIISEENLIKVFKRIEDKIECSINDEIKQRYLIEFKEHYTELEKVLSNEKEIKK